LVEIAQIKALDAAQIRLAMPAEPVAAGAAVNNEPAHQAIEGSAEPVAADRDSAMGSGDEDVPLPDAASIAALE
jgi:hypothetical protein